MTSLDDVIVLGGGPAALCLAAALAEQALQVSLLAPHYLPAPWPNTYGIWVDEVEALGLAHLLEHRWSHTVSYFGAGAADPADPANAPMAHGRDYGLFDREGLQRHWLTACERGGVSVVQGKAERFTLDPAGGGSVVHTADGAVLHARLVVDATGHGSALMRRPHRGPVAGQAAYGVVGRFTAPPVEPGQFVLMDYRADHLSAAERAESPTFLYAMDLGGGRFFVEETSLGLAPPVPYAVLKQRLEQRLTHRGVAISAVEHEEFCLFPMNLPLPDLDQPLLGFGGAAALARAGWQALWPRELRRKHALYQFGLKKLMRFSEPQLRAHFATFFSLPQDQWFGFLVNTSGVPELLAAMLRLFATAPWSVKAGLMGMQGREWALGIDLIWPR